MCLCMFSIIYVCVVFIFFLFFFFKQKTAYEMRISDWSSDVCSSDLENSILLPAPLARVWRLVFDVNRYRDWHPDIGLESDPNAPKKLIYTYWRPGQAEPNISVAGSILRLQRPSDFAWRVGIRRRCQIEEAVTLEQAPQETGRRK